MTNSKYLIFENLLKQKKIKFESEIMVKNLNDNAANFKHKYRVDYFIEKSFIVEIEGGNWSENSRHTNGKGFHNDCLKYNAIVSMGFPVLRFTTQMIKKTPVQIVDFIEKYLRAEIKIEYLSEFTEKHKIK
jgi:very-short-patch-repair endonuclease